MIHIHKKIHHNREVVETRFRKQDTMLNKVHGVNIFKGPWIAKVGKFPYSFFSL